MYIILIYICVTKANNMKTLNLTSKKVTESSAKEIGLFVYNNKEKMSNELKMFYQDVKGIIEIQLKKKAKKRMNMQQILERAYNIESYVLASGAASFETQFVKL